MQGHEKGSKQNFFRHRPCDVVAPANPAAESLVECLAPDPFLPSAFDKRLLEERTGKEKRGQQEAFRYLDKSNGIPSKQSKYLRPGSIGAGRQDVDGCDGREGHGHGDEAYTGPDDGRGVTG